METNNQVMNSWMNYQNQLMENWLATSSKLTKAATEANPLEAGTHLYKEWMEKQNALMQDVLNASKENPLSADMLKNMFEKNQEFSNLWVESLKKIAEKQQNSSKDVFGNTQKQFDNWMGMYSDWYKSLANSNHFQGFSNPMFDQTNSLKDFMSNYSNSMKSYMNMADMWTTYQNALQKGNIDFDAFKRVMSFEKLEDNFKNYMGYFTNERMKEVNEKLFRSFNENMEHLKNMFPQSISYNDWTKVFAANPFERGIGVFGDSFSAAGNKLSAMFEPFMKLVPPSKEKESYERSKRLSSLLGEYATKSAELQTLVFQTYTKSIEKQFQEGFEKAKTGKVEDVNYTEFYKKWIDVLENDLIALFASEKFSVLQGKMLGLNNEIKMESQKQMEEYLSQYPVITRTEADELHKNVYELKTKVRNLEKKLEEFQSQATPAKKSPSKKGE